MPMTSAASAASMPTSGSDATLSSDTYRTAIDDISSFLAPVLVASGKKRPSSSLVTALLSQVPTVNLGDSQVTSDQARLIRYALHLLNRVFLALSRTETINAMYATKDTKLLFALLDLVALEGIYTNVSPGVGVPLSRRAKTHIASLITADSKDTLRYGTDYGLLRDIFNCLSQIINHGGSNSLLVALGERSRVDMISTCGELAFGPSDGSEVWKNTFKKTLDGTPISVLLPLITSMIHPATPTWYRLPLTAYLSRIPSSHPFGVKHILEFLVDTSPGRNIQLQELQHASKLIGALPSSISRPEDHYAPVAGQLVALLDVPSTTSSISQAAAFVIGDISVRRKSFVDRHLVRLILLPLNPTMDQNGLVMKWTVEMGMAITEEELHLALKRLSILVALPNPMLITRLVKPLLLNLWAIYTFASSRKKSHWEGVTGGILQTYVKVSGGSSALILITHDLLYDGETEWTYGNGDLGGIAIHDREESNGALFDLTEVDKKIDNFLNLLSTVDESGLSKVFLDVLTTWLSKNPLGDEDPFRKYAGLKLLEAILEQHSEVVARQPSQTIELIRQILVDYVEDVKAQSTKKHLLAKPSLLNLGVIVDNTKDETTSFGEGDVSNNEVVTVALGLLSALLSADSMPKFKNAENELLFTLVPSLQYIVYSSSSDSLLSSLAMNISALISSQTKTSLADTTALLPIDKQASNDKEKYATALQYLRDPLIPVRAHGLSMVQELIDSRSVVLDIPQTLQLLISILQDEESFVFLNAIKCLVALGDKHSSTVLITLLTAYEDSKQELSIDERLKIGEVLLRTVERLGEALFGDVAASIATSMLNIAGRRSRREKELRELEATKKATADVKLDVNHEDKQEYVDIMRQVESELGIVDIDKDKKEQGNNLQEEESWISKEGEEDLRLRGSAMSILGMLLETNLLGLSTITVAASLDAALNILSLETSIRQVTLRRAAVMMILGVLKGVNKKDGAMIEVDPMELDNTRRILVYVQATDNDGLVREQAGIVLEGLQIIQYGA